MHMEERQVVGGSRNYGSLENIDHYLFLFYAYFLYYLIILKRITRYINTGVDLLHKEKNEFNL